MKKITAGRAAVAALAAGAWLWIDRAGVAVWPFVNRQTLVSPQILPPGPLTATVVLVIGIAAIYALGATLGSGNWRPRT